MPSDAPKPAKLQKNGDFAAAALDELFGRSPKDSLRDMLLVDDKVASEAERSARKGLREIGHCQDVLAKLPDDRKFELNRALIEYSGKANDALSRKTIDDIAPGFRGHWDAARMALKWSKDPSELPADGPTVKQIYQQRSMSALRCHQAKAPDLVQWTKPDSLSTRWLEAEIAAMLKPLSRPNGPLPTVDIGNRKVNYPDFAGRTFFAGDKIEVGPELMSLESKSDKRQQWLNEEEALTRDFLRAIPERDKIAVAVERQFNFEMRSPVVEVGNRSYFWKNTGLQNQSVLYATDKTTGETKAVLDPNDFSRDGRNAVSNVRVSDDGRYFRLDFSEQGYLPTTKTYDSKSGGFLVDTHARPVQNQWNVRPPAVGGFGDDEKRKWHELGSFEAGIAKAFYSKVNQFDDATRKVASDSEYDYWMTIEKAPHHKLIAKNRKTNEVKTILPESDKLLADAQLIGGKLVASYVKDGSSCLEIHNKDGKLEREIPLPGNGTVRHLQGRAEDDHFRFFYTDFLTPGTAFKYDLKKGELIKEFEAKPPFDKNDFQVEKVTSKSKDGTSIPLWIVHRKDVKLDGSNPTYITGYGGFASCKMPQFEKGNMAFLNSGGIVALAVLRGGNEFGDKWHDAGTVLKKQNVFDDMVSAATFLIDHKYTSSSKLAVGGRSNGGLMVGALMTERPDLFGAAIAEVGVLDMKRFPDVGNRGGTHWISEYGSPEKVEELRNLMKYSPLHNISRGKNYPPTLVMTCENDGVVHPSHSFKFVAALQGDGYNKNPTLLYVAKRTGHGPGKSTEQQIEEYTNKWAFLKSVLK